MKKDEKIVTYGINKNGSVDAVEEINGRLIANYQFCDYKEMRKYYKGKHYNFVNIKKLEWR